MQERDLYRMINEKEATIASASFPALMRKVYTWMALAW